jgi:hypothetical protein
MLLVVVAIVLVLAARQWQEAAPTLMELDGGSQTGIEDHGLPEAVGALGDLPGLNDMRDSTTTHAEDLNKALEAIE